MLEAANGRVQRPREVQRLTQDIAQQGKVFVNFERREGGNPDISAKK